MPDKNERLIDLIYQLEIAAASSNTEKVEEIRTQILELTSKLHLSSNEQNKVKSIVDMAQNVATINESINPIAENAQSIIELKKHKKEFEETLSYLKKNKSDIEVLVNQHLKYKKFVARIVAILASIGIGWGSLLVWSYNTASNELKTLAKQEQSDLSEFVTTTLNSQKVIQFSKELVRASHEKRYNINEINKAIDNTNQAISKLTQRLDSNFYYGINPLRLQETILLAYSYRDQLQAYNNSDFANTQNRERILKCSTPDFLLSHRLLSTSLIDWANGYTEQAMKGINASWMKCNIFESQFLKYWLIKATSEHIDENLISVNLETAKINFEGVSKALYNTQKDWVYFILMIDTLGQYIGDKSKPTQQRSLLNNYFTKLNIHTSSNQWKAIHNHYKGFFEWITSDKSSKQKNETFIHSSAQALKLWPNFHKLSNNILSLGFDTDLIQLGISYDEYINHTTTMQEVFATTFDVSGIDTVLISSFKIINNKNNHASDARQNSFRLTIKQYVEKICHSSLYNLARIEAEIDNRLISKEKLENELKQAKISPLPSDCNYMPPPKSTQLNASA